MNINLLSRFLVLASICALFSGFTYISKPSPDRSRKEFLKEIYLYSCILFGLEKIGTRELDISLGLTMEISGDYSKSLYDVSSYGRQKGHELNKKNGKSNVIRTCLDLSLSDHVSKAIDEIERVSKGKMITD